MDQWELVTSTCPAANSSVRITPLGHPRHLPARGDGDKTRPLRQDQALYHSNPSRSPHHRLIFPEDPSLAIQIHLDYVLLNWIIYCSFSPNRLLICNYGTPQVSWGHLDKGNNYLCKRQPWVESIRFQRTSNLHNS